MAAAPSSPSPPPAPRRPRQRGALLLVLRPCLKLAPGKGHGGVSSTFRGTEVLRYCRMHDEVIRSTCAYNRHTRYLPGWHCPSRPLPFSTSCQRTHGMIACRGSLPSAAVADGPAVRAALHAVHRPLADAAHAAGVDGPQVPLHGNPHLRTRGQVVCASRHAGSRASVTRGQSSRAQDGASMPLAAREQQQQQW